MHGGILVDQILFGATPSLSPWHLAFQAGAVKGAALRAVAPGLETVPALSRVPAVDDYLHRQFRCQTVPEGTDDLRTRCGARDEFQGVDLLELRHFHSRIVYSRAFARHFVADTKPVLRLCALADGDPA